ncbi:redox-sensing transcriptional repressor Rex [Companilactobacillus alimentarius]|uniref:Redox-sensing transcriptional repressor Rex n=1 Tax=Companilactobacillus alimentarius DSM 20249 TaxID=1423720 RepID=A0A2K9HJL7_9LACO|nr:redox-sensing transcriptional repressor Rex [Companilactobacillus alimentarius]AUI72709.1 redox-sensing transcriptional repressor Rex [Companilactobacillus alimentarius DSM 20249]KRK75600.1 redox-sensing transcriptional repressor Rex [Companilactobacillus alimentarius DSM 20249]MDT6952127.1 redox-sensing transcriptional repressor Rex [Companilactobacillus alimentarius]GEO45363.1 redox-sensing transcriptional repressor Rex [Companilactobacillus alimentarius]
MTKTIVPNATIKRLPIYYRYFQFLKDEGTKKISSGELSEGVKIDSATIRRDFSYLGALGKRGYGYDVNNLVAFFKKLLNQDKRTNVALIGVGNLGNALLNYNFSRTNNVRIAAAFDVNKDIVGTVKSGVPVYDISELKEQLHLQQIDVCILTVSSNAAQTIADLLADAGVRGVLNFTPVIINVPSSIRVHYVDLANELQTLIFFLDRDKSNNNEEQEE